MRSNSKPTTVVKMQREANSGGALSRAHNVRALNPGPKSRRRPSLKRMVGLGSQTLDRLLQKPELAQDAELREEILAVWDSLERAWKSTSGDRRSALTLLQGALHTWTSEDAWVADDTAIQRYRRQLHRVLDL